MPQPQNEPVVYSGLAQALLDGLEMALEGEEKNSRYGWYDGLWFSIEPLDARQAGCSAYPGGTIASHADPILVTWRLMQGLLRGQAYQTDWEASWSRRRQPSQDEWTRLKSDLQHQAPHSLTETRSSWSQAHTAYHAGAVRQILKAQG